MAAVHANANVESIAKREKCSVRQVNMTISLAFLAPALVKAAIAGRLPRGIGVTRLRDAPVECGDGQASSWRWRWRTRRRASPGR
jgi:hypothetical protein